MLNEMFILRTLKVSIKRKNLKGNSKEAKNKLRIERKSPAERRREALSNFFHSVIEKPVRFILRITIPTSEKEKWHRGFACANPVGSLLIFLLASDRKFFQVD